jgi:putative ATPase
MVDCPVCEKAVKDSKINEHLDSGCTDFLIEQEQQHSTPNPTKSFNSFFTGARKPPGSTQKNGNPTSSPPVSARIQPVERPKTPLPGAKRSLDEAAEGQTNGEQQSPPVPKRARRMKAVEDAMPLAERMRPTSLDDVCGQELVGPGGLLRGMVNEGKSLPSMVLWGRPGTVRDEPLGQL